MILPTSLLLPLLPLLPPLLTSRCYLCTVLGQKPGSLLWRVPWGYCSDYCLSTARPSLIASPPSHPSRSRRGWRI